MIHFTSYVFYYNESQKRESSMLDSLGKEGGEKGGAGGVPILLAKHSLSASVTGQRGPAVNTALTTGFGRGAVETPPAHPGLSLALERESWGKNPLCCCTAGSHLFCNINSNIRQFPLPKTRYPASSLPTSNFRNPLCCSQLHTTLPANGWTS